MNKFDFSPVTFREEMDKLRSKGVAVANAQTETARQALAGLMNEDVTKDGVVIIALAAHGNPKSPKGKVSETLSGLRYATGGEAARKSLDAAFRVFDARQTEGVEALIVAFIDKEKDAAKGIFALDSAVKALVKASLGDAAADGEGEDGEGEDSEGDEPAAKRTLADDVFDMAKAIVDAPTSELEQAETALAELFAAIEGASQRIADKANREQLAA